MRIAYFINQYPKVSHSFIRREILALERQGVQVKRFALRGWADAVADPEDAAELPRTRYLLRGGLMGLVRASLRAAIARPRCLGRAFMLALRMGRRADRPLPLHLVYLAEACQLYLWLVDAGAQHVHAHFGTNSAEVVMLAHALGGPGYSFTVHGPEEFDKPQALHLAAKMQAARFVVAISSYGRSQLYRWLPVDQWGKVQVVHCGLDQAFHSVPAQPVPQAPRLVCVGRLCEQKGQLLLVQALALLKQRGVVCELVLAGDGEMRPQVEAEMARHGLQAQVRITGWIASGQVRDELLNARALVLPSFAEGLPVVIMEAMALRRPVLSTYVAGIPELVQPGRTGWLFPAGDVDALADAMQACLAAPPDELQAMGDAARERVLQRHDVDTEAAKLLTLFRAHQPGQMR
ncbi:MAG: colanic acid biosynthesis glycosyltransferase WcaL [Comamonas sp. SCN 65-56]|uniref:glycosyltransferase n=1 Tax=Comamonas sp. SCN 65-56 TaxID=1660095 RepID=UPI0008693A3F|nr:glycosyltransferase [Comamonas sp. SCN 65-56]ODS94024.1 MAG: colanic acid biosynthesis glycosyltransferase WcaL [Comamonas sp. SCN 65-56]